MENQILPLWDLLAELGMPALWEGRMPRFTSVPLAAKLGRAAQCLLSKQKENTKRKKEVEKKKTT